MCAWGSKMRIGLLLHDRKGERATDVLVGLAAEAILEERTRAGIGDAPQRTGGGLALRGRWVLEGPQELRDRARDRRPAEHRPHVGRHGAAGRLALLHVGDEALREG